MRTVFTISNSADFGAHCSVSLVIIFIDEMMCLLHYVALQLLMRVEEKELVKVIIYRSKI